MKQLNSLLDTHENYLSHRKIPSPKYFHKNNFEKNMKKLFIYNANKY